MKVSVDGVEVHVRPGATILEACGMAGVEVPTLCHHPGLEPRPSCFVCVVRVVGRRRLAPACATPAEEGMVVDASSAEIRQARRASLELLLSDHAGDCIAPCQTVCPAGVRIPEALRLIASGEFGAAFRVFEEAAGLVHVVGRLCHRPCEQGCRRNQHDGGLGIRALELFAASVGSDGGEPPSEPMHRPVAVVGGGATGLSAAHHLARLGHPVTLLEGADRLGGRLWRHVPNPLPADALEADLLRLRQKVRPRLGVRVSGPEGLKALLQDHAAVLVACGTEAPESFPELLRSAQGIQVARETYATSEPGVYAAGSAVAPVEQVIRRIAAGRRAAEAIHQAVTGRTAREHPFSVHVGRMDPASLDRYVALASPLPKNSRADDAGCLLTTEEARTEALRCLRCSCATQEQCRLRRLAIEYEAQPSRYAGQRRRPEVDDTHPELLFEPGKCISCGICVRLAQNDRGGVGLTQLGRGFDLRIGPPIGFTLAQALGDTARRCAEACPTSALSLRTWPREATDHE